MKKVTYLVPMRITAWYKEGRETKQMEMSFKVWKHGKQTSNNVLFEISGVRAGEQISKNFGKRVFENVRDMVKDDGLLG